MAIVVNWSNQAATAVATYTGLSVGPPSGSTVAQGDLLVVMLSCNYDATGLMAPAGWTLLRDDADAAAGWQAAVYWKIAGASDVGTPSYSFGATAGSSGGPSLGVVLVDIGGADSTTPIDVSSGAPGSGTSPTAPSVRTTASGDLLLVLVDISWAYNQALTFPAGWTQLESVAEHAWLGSAYQIQSSAGDTGSVVVTAVSSQPWVTELVAIKPVATSGATVSISASGASASGASASGAVARPITGAAASDSGASVSASASTSSGAASARRVGAATLISDSSVAALVAAIRSAVASIASSTASAALTLAYRAVGATGASVSAVSASALVVGSAILGAAASVSATTMLASEAVRRGASAALDATSGISARAVLGRVGAVMFASISAIHGVGQVAGSTLATPTTIAITLDMELADTVVIEAGLSDAVQLAMPLEEV